MIEKLGKYSFLTPRRKTMFIIGLTVAGLIVILYATSEIILMGGFAKVEEERTSRNADRALGAIADDISDLNGDVGDWAGWDETYRFIQDGDLSYVERNIPDTTFSELRLNLMLFMNSSGGIVFGRGFDLMNGTVIPVPESIIDHLSLDSVLLQHHDTESSVTGILLLPEGPMLIASRPITDNERVSPIRGSLIWGRYLDSSEIERIAGITRLSLTVFRFDDPMPPPEFIEARNSLSEKKPIFIRAGEPGIHTISGYSMLKDVYENPALMLRVDSDRAIYEQGQTTVNYFLISFLLLGLFFGGVTLSLFDKIGISTLARRESEERYHAVVEHASEGILLADSDTKQFMEANAALQAMLGYTSSEISMLTLYDVVPDDREMVDNFVQDIIREKNKFLGEQRYKRKEGSVVDVEVSANLISYGGKKVLCFVVHDITERKRAEEQIRISLEEKEVLLREIYHRVKNNMQIISSLLKLQSGYVKEEKYREMFKESQDRIMSMSLVHEKLYRSKDLARIDFKNYIMDLTRGLLQSYGDSAGSIKLNINVENILLGIDSAIPCGLIINELVTNSLKHAFPQGRKGEIKISLISTGENMIELTVSDNGVGFPKDLDFRRVNTLGLHLVTILAENQLHGEIILDQSSGTEFRLNLKR